MPLSPCRECKQQVSRQAASCPHCGAPRPAELNWRGTGYEWKSQASYLGYPLIHVAWGQDEHGNRRVAKGVIAIGQFAVGLITIAQFGVGLLFGCGQFIFGLATVSQFAAGIVLGIGQFATGYISVSMLGAGYLVLCLWGLGTFVYSAQRQDPEAALYFNELFKELGLPIEL